jgi:AcrR family transcriptional regulator
MLRLSTFYNSDVAHVNIVAQKFACGAETSQDIAHVAHVNTGTVYSWHTMRQRKPYHHGHLREALLQAAIQLIAEVGPAGFTLREVARRAGVSHNAPYRHFPEQADLLAAVAAEGFRELNQAMLDAVGHHRGSVGRLKRAGLAYVEFALRRPEHFTVMFDANVSKHKTPDSAEAAGQAFGTLLSLVTKCQGEDRLPSGDPRQLALLAWSMVHGIAKLATAKRLPYESTADVLKFAEFVIDESLPVRKRLGRKRIASGLQTPVSH